MPKYERNVRRRRRKRSINVSLPVFTFNSFIKKRAKKTKSPDFNLGLIIFSRISNIGTKIKIFRKPSKLDAVSVVTDRKRRKSNRETATGLFKSAIAV